MRSLLFPAVIVASAAAHVAAGAFLDGRTPEAPRAPAEVEIAVAPKPEPPPLPAPPAPPPAPLARAMPHTPRPAARPPAPRIPPPEKAPQTPAAPADLTGVTLTNDTGAGWVTATGNGEPAAAPIAASKPAAQAAAHGDDGPPVVALADLSRAPGAPELDDALREHYPREAQQRGVAGKAVVRARIAADGEARVLAIVSESAPGFGDACRHTVAGSRWRPPLDRRGIAVTTEITYTCRFEVGG